jgi:hypothetical protein
MNGEKFARRATRAWRLRRQRHIGSSCDSLDSELLAPHHARLLAPSGAAAFGRSVADDAASGRAGASGASQHIRTFQILRKATNSAECCLFRRFFQISAVFLFWRTVLNTRPRRFDRIFAKGQAASTIFRREYAARGFAAHVPKRLSPEAEGKWCGATDQGVSENSRPAVRV